MGLATLLVNRFVPWNPAGFRKFQTMCDIVPTFDGNAPSLTVLQPYGMWIA